MTDYLTAMTCSSSTACDLLHHALLLSEWQRLHFLNELDAGTTTPRHGDDDDVVSLSDV
jgi:hypothetical protein